MIYWIIVDRENPALETAWMSSGRLLLVETKEFAVNDLQHFFVEGRQTEKIVVPVQVEIVSEADLEACDGGGE